MVRVNKFPLIFAILLLISLNCVAANRNVSIGGTQESWLDTGIILDGKKAIKAKAQGEINYCGGAPQCDATPDGSVSGESHCGGGITSAGGALCGALIARVGGVEGTSFILGTGVTIPKTYKGRLEIGIQDFKFDDNSGSFNVTFSGVKREKFDLSGYVLGSSGIPFPKERVFATFKDKRYASRTDANGRYQFNELPEGKYTIAVERTIRFPKTFTPLDSEPLNFAFSPRRKQVNLTQDLNNENFVARKFSTLKAPFREVRKKRINGLCSLSFPRDNGAVAQVDGVQRGTQLRMRDSFFAEGFTVKVIGDGPYDDGKFNVAQLACVGKQSADAGIGLPLNSGGAENRGVAIVELAPKEQ